MIKSNKKSLALLLLSFVCLICLSLSVVTGFAAATGAKIAPEMKAGAEVRTVADKSGIRFTAYVDDSYFTDGKLNNGTVAGMIITKGEVEAETLTHESNKAGGAYEGAVLDIPATVWDAKRDIEGKKAFNAVVYNIPETAYGTDLTARAYVKVDNEYVYSSTVCTYSIAEVASYILATGGYEDEDFDVLAGYVDGTNPLVTVGDKTSDKIDVELVVGESVAYTIAPSNLTPIIETENKFVEVKDGKITVKEYIASNTVENITVTLGNKVTVIQVTAKYNDINIKQNLLADFDESDYIGNLVNKSGEKTTLVHASTSIAGANSGVLKIWAYGQYDSINVSLAKTINVDEFTGGIYIRFWVDEATAKVTNAALWVTINGKEVKALSVSGQKPVANSWNYAYISRETIISTCGATKVSGLSFYVYGAAGNWYYVDEIGYVTATGNELLSFDDESDLCMVWGRFVTVQQLTADEAGYPTGKGATTGVAELPQVDDGCPSQFYFKQSINTANVSAIILRMYVPKSAGDHRIRVYVNSNTGTRTEITAASAPLKIYDGNDTFIDVLVNLSSIASGTILTSLEIQRHWKINNTTTSSYYLDSITYVAK